MLTKSVFGLPSTMADPSLAHTGCCTSRSMGQVSLVANGSGGPCFGTCRKLFT